MSCFLFLSLVMAVMAGDLVEEAMVEPCSLCTAVVNTLEEFATEAIPRAQLMDKLSLVSEMVCAHVPNTILSQDKCNSFVALYGPYTIDLLLANVKPQEICSNLGICDDSSSPKYEILFPTIQEDRVIYSAIQKDLNAETKFHYKIFLGTPQFLNNQTYALDVQVNNITDSGISLQVTNRTDYVETDECNTGTPCKLHVSKPGMGVWYYITLSVKPNGDQSSFVLEITEKNSQNGYWKYVGGSHVGTFILLLVATFLGVCVLCLVVTKCLFGNRVSKVRHADIEEADFLYEPQKEMFEPSVSPMLIFISPDQFPMEYAMQPVQMPYAITQE